MSVVVRNTVTDELFVFAKGAEDKILELLC